MSQTLSFPAVAFTAGGKEFDFTSEYLASLPSVSIAAALRRGFAHMLGNEVASKVSAYKAGKGEAGSEGYVAPVTDEALIAEFAAKAQATMLDAILDGTVGQGRGPGAPKLSPIDAIIREFATQEVSAKFKTQNLKLPTGDKTATIRGVAMTRDEILAKWIAVPANAERLTKEATAELKARQRRADKVTAAEGEDIF